MEPGTRPLPAWFDDAKLGIFVHWTAAAVPAYAPVTDSPFDLAADGGWEEAMRCSPYVEWYQNSIAIEGSPAALHHAEHHGDRPYDDFVEHVPRRPRRLAGRRRGPTCSQAAGARYVVLVTKHHDGVLLWPSATPNPHKAGGRRARPRRRPGRRRAGARTCASAPTTRAGSTGPSAACRCATSRRCSRAIPQTPEYLAYADAHWHELIERYRPDVLWNDIGYPAAADLAGAVRALLRGGARRRGQQPLRLDGADAPAPVHCDFVTPEYSTKGDPNRKWESTPRHRHQSFGYNRQESDVDVPVARRAGADVRRRGRPRRQPAAQRRAHRRRRDPVGAGAAPARPRLVAAHQRRRDLRHPAVDPHRRHDR